MAEENYGGEERRQAIVLSEEQLEAIAERAAQKVLQQFQLEVGRLTIRGALYLIGALCLAGLAYLGLTQKVKLPL